MVVTWPFALRLRSDNPAEGVDALSAISWAVYGKRGSDPKCCCPVIAQYVKTGNDAMPDDERQRLLVYLPRIAGSRSEEHEEARLRLLRLAAVRVFVPRALDAAGLHGRAESLRELPKDVDMEIASGRASRAAQVAHAAWEEAKEASPEAAAAASWAAAAAYAAARAAARLGPAATWSMWIEGAWDDYFDVLDDVLNAGPQGAPWTAEMVERGVAALASAGGMARAA